MYKNIFWRAPFYYISNLKLIIFFIPIIIIIFLTFSLPEIGILFYGIWALIIIAVYTIARFIEYVKAEDRWQILFMKKITAKYILEKDKLLIRGERYTKTIPLKQIDGLDFNYRKWEIDTFISPSRGMSVSERSLNYQYVNIKYKKNNIGYIKYREIYIPREKLDVIVENLNKRIINN
jgi:hypothetical protein